MQLMREERVKGGQLAVVIAGVLLFYKTMPYFFWHGIFSSNYTNAIVTIVLGFIFFFNLRALDSANKLLMLLFGAILISYPFVGDQNFNVFVSIAPLIFLPFASDVFGRKVYHSFLTIYCVVILISLFIWVLSLVDVIHPYKVIPPLNDLKDFNYNVYPLLVRPNNGGFRFSGPFDEPGVVGTISGLFFCCQKKLSDKRSLILSLSGICSFSLFFFVIVGLYFIYIQLLTNKNKKGVAVFGLVLFAVFILISTMPVFSDMILSRLEFDSDTGMFAGDNRNSSYAIELFDQIKGSREFWLGIDNKWDYQEKVGYSSSFLNVIIMFGMLFSSLIIVFYIIYGWVNRSTTLAFIIYVLIVAGTLYQRPGIFNPEFIFLFTILARKDTIFAINLMSRSVARKSIE